MSSPKLSGSGSIQSHLSTANQRIKSSSVEGANELGKKSDHADPQLPPPCSSSSHHTSQYLHISKVYRVIFHSEGHQSTTLFCRFRQWVIICIKITITLYCCFSLVFTPFMAYVRVFSTNGPGVIEPESTTSLSDSLKTSRSILYQPESHYLQPGALPGVKTNQSISVCMWADESELVADISGLVQWGVQWDGPISLLVTTQVSKSVFSNPVLIESLKRLQRQRGLASLSVHILHINTTHKTYSPNALINTARLLASTSHVLLAPGGHSSVPFNHFRDEIMMWTKSSLSVPSILHNTTSLKYPLPALTPLLVSRDSSFWCPERFFYLTDRVSTWNKCLWQFWLTTEGKFSVVRSAIPTQKTGEQTLSESELKYHQRLSLIFKNEMCDLSIKKLMMLEMEHSTSLQKRLDWVKRFCRRTTNNTFKPSLL